jgi:hypothetical protein
MKAADTKATESKCPRMSSQGWSTIRTANERELYRLSTISAP